MTTPAQGIEVLSWLVKPEPWQADAACKGLDPGLFHMDQGQSAANAREVCDACSVAAECLDYGQRTGSVGVWGGVVLTLKRQTKKAPKPEPVEVPVLTIVKDARPKRVTGVKRRHRTTSAPDSTGQIAASRAR